MLPRAVIGLLWMVGVRSAFPDTVYVKTGSDFGVCDMKCPQRSGVLQLFPPCQVSLAEVHCDSLKVEGHPEPRFQLNMSSGCWKMRDLRKEDSCEYIVWHQLRQLSSTHISVLDPVLISNISSNFSRLGEEMAVSVQFSGEESAVTWEVDGEPLPERYRLIDDNRTLIIPGVQRDDAERRFRVRITNPVSEEIREYRLDIGETDPLTGRSRVPILAAVICVGVMTYLVYRRYRKKESQDHQSPEIPEHGPLGVTVNGHGQPIQNGSKATGENGSKATGENGSKATRENGSKATGENGSKATGEKGSKATGEKGSKATGENGSKATGENGSKATGENGSKATGENGSKATGENGSKATGENGSKATGENGSKATGENGSKATGENGSKATGENGFQCSKENGSHSV